MNAISNALNLSDIAGFNEQECEFTVFKDSHYGPFNDYEFMKDIRVHNGKNSFLVTQWNGSPEQKEALSKKLKGRNITWGDSISKAKSKTNISIIFNGEVIEIASICKFANDNRLNPGTIRRAYKLKQPCLSMGNRIEFV